MPERFGHHGQTRTALTRMRQEPVQINVNC